MYFRNLVRSLLNSNNQNLKIIEKEKPVDGSTGTNTLKGLSFKKDNHQNGFGESKPTNKEGYMHNTKPKGIDLQAKPKGVDMHHNQPQGFVMQPNNKNKPNSDQDKKISYFKRAKRDREHPYVMISKSLFRDTSITLKAKGLLGYLLCLPDDWKVNPKQIAKQLKVGRDTIYSGIKELEKAGYCKRTQFKDEFSRYSQLIYEFSEEPIFREKNPLPENQEMEMEPIKKPIPEVQDLEGSYLQNTKGTEYRNTEDIKESNTKRGAGEIPFQMTTLKPSDKTGEMVEKKETHKVKGFSYKVKQFKESQSSPAANDLFVFFLSLMKNKNPKMKDPDRKKWITEIDKIMTIDKRNLAELKDVLTWAFNQDDDFWPTAIQSPATLRKLYDRAWAKMNHKSKAKREKEQNAQKLRRIEENRDWATTLLTSIKFRDTMQIMKLRDGFVEITNGKEWTPLGFGEENFRKIIVNKLRNWGYLTEQEIRDYLEV